MDADPDRSPVDLDALVFDERGLIPVIAQDVDTDEVLMLAWANRESLERTLAEGRMVYWSRSRGELWRKGDTSGHVQHWEELRADCDGDVVLARIHQEGPACHTGARSCFFRTLGDLMLKLVIPKGSLEEQTLRLLEAADLRVRRGAVRDYHGTIDDDRIDRVSVLRPQEIPTYVQDGFFDVGITGQDWIAETGADVKVLTTLSYAKSGTGHGTRIVLAVPAGHPANSAAEMPAGSRISTEFLHLTEKYFADLGIPVKVVWSYGATEAKVPEIVDAIVDITETGNTLRGHGMKVIETLLRSEPVLVANRESWADPTKRAAMDDITTLLLGALRAESSVLIKLNVTKDQLEAVLGVVPSMKAPTVSPLSEGGFAIETVVDKQQVNRLIPQLKSAGATDILELSISKIVP